MWKETRLQELQKRETVWMWYGWDMEIDWMRLDETNETGWDWMRETGWDWMRLDETICEETRIDKYIWQIEIKPTFLLLTENKTLWMDQINF